MSYLLFFFFLVIFCLLLNRLSFVKHSGLSTGMITGLFLIKVLAGILLGWISARYYPQGNDYWDMNSYGWKEFQLLLHEPGSFFTNIFHSPYGGYGGFFDSVGSYWKDLGTNIIIKIVAIADLFSRGNYYINSLFFSFTAFLAHVALYRVFMHAYTVPKWPVIIGCFLLPSAIYFTSGLHKDTIVFFLSGTFTYAFYFSLRERFTVKRVFIIAGSLALILLIRNYLFIALIPASLAMYISRKAYSPLKVFAIIYITCFCILIVSAWFLRISPLNIISHKQQDFLKLPVAASQLPTDTLQPTLASFAANLPRAVNHGLFRPYVWEAPGILVFPAIELLLFELLFLFMLSRRRPKLNDDPFVYFGIFLSLTIFIFAGYVVPNAGSLIRYRSLYLPFLITPVLIRIWNSYYIK